MGKVVLEDLKQQILWDHLRGLDLSPPKLKRGQDILSDYDEFLDEDTIMPLLFEEFFDEEE
jgi:hypothetical protein